MMYFLQAVNEHNSCEVYANMCRCMSQFKVTTPTLSAQGGVTQTSTVEFRKVLLTRCQKEFERDRTSEDKLSNLQKKVEDAKTPVSNTTKKYLRRKIFENLAFVILFLKQYLLI